MTVVRNKVMEFKDNAKALFGLAGDNCKSKADVDFFSWSSAAVDAVASIFCGEAFANLGLERVSDNEEVVHLVYYYYLRRLADPGAIERLRVRERAGLVEYCQAAILRSEEYSLHGRSDFTIDLSANADATTQVFVDVTNTTTTKARTGIQRVVRELSRELQGSAPAPIIYIAYSRSAKTFKRVALSNDEFVEVEAAPVVCFNRGDVYFDVDGSWGDAVSRWPLYQQLRRGGVRILNIHYDAAPILFPMYSHPITVLRFLEHFFAASNCSDHFLCISEAVQKDYVKIATLLKGRCAPSSVMPLGNVFSALSATEEEIPPEVRAFSSQRFVLFVGTVEPRKNYSLLIQNFKTFERHGLKVILVGKKGWESDEVVAQLEAAQQAGNFLWLQNATDGVLKHLYETCYVYASVAHYEGYGLPVLEALSYGCAVVTSDGGALEEVGRGYTLSFRLDDEQGLSRLVDSLVADTVQYQALKANVGNFHAPVWADSIAKVLEVMEVFLLKVEQPLAWEKLQLVYISIRPDSLQRSLLSFKKFGHDGAVVVLTSDAMKAQVEEVLASLNINGTVRCDEDMFVGERIPADHQERNFQLRKRLYNDPVLDTVFLSLDDDAILLKPLPATYYVENGRYNGHFYYSSMANWNASPFGITSYDQGQWRTSALLCAHAYDDKAYSAHQPQILEKRLVQEIYDEYANCVAGGVDEWSLYFNVCVQRYSNRFAARPVTTLHWPEDFSSWMPGWFNSEVHYMNYYPASASAADAFINLLSFAAAYDKYHAQRIIGGVAKPVRLLPAEDNVVAGLPGLWVDIKADQGMSGVGYRIYAGETVVVDGSRDIQAVSPRAPLKVKMPAEPGEFRLNVFYVESGADITSASVIVFPWRQALQGV
ncbi:Glycos_transf_1 domain-containing protein [Pseudomonas donghuensis]